MNKEKDNIIIRYKELAEIFLKNNTKAFIKDIEGTYYFCDILFVGEDKLRVQCFAPDDKKGVKFDIYWPLVVSFKEYEAKNE